MTMRRAMWLRFGFGLAAGMNLILPVGATPPVPAQGRFVSHDYALTFRAPSRLTYCRIADDWTGSDHGTILFLTPPRECGGVGYPSISRGFDPPDTPRIEVEYERWENETPIPQRPCVRAGHVAFLDHVRILCRRQEGRMVALAIEGLYTADSQALAIVTLLTTPARIRQDLPILRRLAATVHSCTVPWRDQAGHRRHSGSGRPCPQSGDFY